jgi:hypothetical protein
MGLRQTAGNLGQLLDRPATLDWHTQHLAEHRDADLKPTPVKSTSTVCERKSAEATLNSRANSRLPDVSSATNPASAT